MRARNTLAACLVAIASCAAFSRHEPRWPSPRGTTLAAVAPGVIYAAVLSPARAVRVSTVPSPAAPARDDVAGDADVSLIEHQPVCIGARHWSAGHLGETVLYRHRRVGTKLEVGYFVYWSTERPWGDNVLSYTLLPALVIDAAYSHFMYVMPGVKDLIHGAADVEGVRIELEERDGKASVVGGTADDGFHRPVALSRQDLVDARGRIVLLTDAWSHQLGAHGAGAFAAAHDGALRCYEGPALRPMTGTIARAFRLGSESAPRRAKPAWLSSIATSEVPAG